jgi:hypothetical protein
MAPAYGLAEEIKRALYADAVRLCRHVGYKNAGTVEFMVDKDGRHYFLEVNPRVQVRRQRCAAAAALAARAPAAGLWQQGSGGRGAPAARVPVVGPAAGAPSGPRHAALVKRACSAVRCSQPPRPLRPLRPQPPPAPAPAPAPALQVEHTVTEEITGLDIVQSQIKIAGGPPAPAPCRSTCHCCCVHHCWRVQAERAHAQRLHVHRASRRNQRAVSPGGNNLAAGTPAGSGVTVRGQSRPDTLSGNVHTVPCANVLSKASPTFLQRSTAAGAAAASEAQCS